MTIMPRYLVELGWRYLHCLGYAVRVSHPISIPGRRGKKRLVFVDVLGFGRDEIVVLECRSIKGVKYVKRHVEKLTSTIRSMIENLRELYGVQRIRPIVLLDDEEINELERQGLVQLIHRHGIEVLRLSKVIETLIDCGLRELECREMRGEGDLILTILAKVGTYLRSRAKQGENSVVEHEQHRYG